MPRGETEPRVVEAVSREVARRPLPVPRSIEDRAKAATMRATPIVNHVGRRRGNEPPLTAASQRIDPASRTEAKKLVGRRQAWQAEAWDVYDEVPEVRRAAQFMGDALRRVHYFPGVRPEPDAPPVHVDDGIEAGLCTAAEAAAVTDAVARLRNPGQGLPELFSDAALQFFQVGEGYLIGRTREREVTDQGVVIDPGGERFDVISIDELDGSESGGFSIRTQPAARSSSGAGGVYFAAPSGAGGDRERLPDDAFMLRLWRRHPRWGDLADAGLRAVLVECEELRLLTLAVRAAALSRLNAGVFVVPARTSSHATGETQGGVPAVSPLTRQIVEQTTVPIADPGSAAAVAPFVLELDPEHCDKARRIGFERDASVEIAQRQELVRRILQGLDVSIELVLGLGDTSTYANARLVSEQDYQRYVAPYVDITTDAFATGYLYAELAARGIRDTERFGFGADPSRLIGKPGQDEAAIVLYDRMEVSGDYLREAAGVPEEAKPDPAEIEERLRRDREASPLYARIQAEEEAGLLGPAPSDTDPNVADGAVEEEADDATDTTMAASGSRAERLRRFRRPPARHGDGSLHHEIEHALTVAGQVEVPALVAASKGTKRAERVQRRLARLEQELRARVHAHMQTLMERGIEKAGAVTRTKARSDQTVTAALAHVGNPLVCATLGPTMTAALDVQAEALLQQVLAGGAERVIGWIESAQEDAIALAESLGDIPAADLAQIRARQAEDRDAGWALMLAAVLVVAHARLFDPNPSAPDSGEFDPNTTLPPGPIRAGLARAGGATGEVTMTSIPGGNGVAVASEVLTAQGAPVAGAVSGPTGLDVYRRIGIQLSGYRWQTGAPKQPFPPHQHLDGAEFGKWDDARLANSGGFPSVAYYRPGDHAGCQCSFEVVLIDSEGG